jgi:hypothetical protein
MRNRNYLNWSRNEAAVEFIRDNAERLTDAKGADRLSQLLGRTISVHAWRKARQRMGLKKCSGRGISKLQKDDESGKTID